MDNLMVFDDREKRRVGIICFIPIICFMVCFVYYLALIIPLAYTPHAAGSIVGITSRNYTTLFLMLATSAIVTAPIFIYCLVLLVRMKHINGAHKIMWIVFLSTLAPIASALFWTFLVRKLPTYVSAHPDIA